MSRSLPRAAGSARIRSPLGDLTLALGYIERLVSNTKVEKYLAKHHGELLNEFRS